MRGAQRGSVPDMEALFDEHWPRAHRAAYLVIQDAALAEDIAQESFLAAIRSLDRFDRRRPFGPWLHRIVVNRAIDAARARSLRRETELTEHATGAEEHEPPDRELLAALARASARPAGRDRAPPPARLHTRRDRSDARPAPRHRQLTPAPGTGHDAGRAVKDALERIPVPDEEPARERAHKVVLTAFAGREPVRRPSQARRVALGVGVAALAVALAVASPPGMAVVDRVREVVAVERTAPALFSLPAPGRLLVASDAGVWVVDADGRKRLLAGYREASWSPFGRFLVATGANELAALEPDGGVRWTLSRPGVRHARWGGTEVDTRIAYLSRSELRVVAGDGTGDRAVGHALAVAPAWRPGAGHVLTYVDRSNRVVTRDLVTGRVLWRVGGRGGVAALEWSGDGRRLNVRRGRRIDVLTRDGRAWTGLRAPDLAVVGSAIRPGSHAWAAALNERGRSEVLVVGEPGGRIFAGRGSVTDLAWSPDGRWLLIARPDADQWVLVRSDGGSIRSVSRIAQQFRSRSFPRLEGWCC